MAIFIALNLSCEHKSVGAQVFNKGRNKVVTSGKMREAGKSGWNNRSLEFLVKVSFCLSGIVLITYQHKLSDTEASHVLYLLREI